MPPRLIFHHRLRVAPLLASLVGCLLIGSLAAAEQSIAEAAGAATSSALVAEPSTLRQELRALIGSARDRVFPALVSIEVLTEVYYGGRRLTGHVAGSGTLISAAGDVLTNQHVTQRGQRFLCTLSDRREVEADLIGEDPLTDLAILRLRLDELSPGELPVAHLGASADLEIGDHVLAMGSPLSLSRSVSLGIVSNTERVFAGGLFGGEIDDMELEQGQRTGLFTRWIQHDALINPGNSGGPLVNLAGEVVGVNELGGNAIGFAIPSDLAERVAKALIEHGEVPRSWLGLSFKPIRRTGLEQGVLINSVVVEGPAERAGVAAGDVLIKFEGEPLTVRFAEQLPALLDRIASLPIGSTVAFEVLRDGASLTAEIVTERLNKDLGDEKVLVSLGISARQITAKMARDRRLKTTFGVLVSGVRSGGPAQLAEPSLQPEDVLLAVDSQPLSDLRQLSTLLRGLSDGGLTDRDVTEGEPQPLLVEFERRGRNHLTLIEPRRQKDREDPPRELPKPWIGIETQPLSLQLAERLDLGGQRGFRITRVYPGTEAERAGLLAGDVLVGLDGATLQPSSDEDRGLLRRLIRRREIGQMAELALLRDGRSVLLSVTLERTRLSRAEARRHRDEDFEISVRELTFFDRDENRWDEDLRGVLVEQAEAGGWVGLGGVRAGDVVLRFADRPVRGLKSFRSALAAVKEERPQRVVMVVLRGVRTRFQYLEPEWTPAG